MPLSLPSRPNLDRLRNEAKYLLKACRAGDSTALHRLRMLRQYAELSDKQLVQADPRLWEAQLAVALEYGFTCWKDLKVRVLSIRAALGKAVPIGLACAGLAGAGGLQGTVKMPDGSPVAGARVILLARDFRDRSYFATQEVSSDSAGKYHFENLGRGLHQVKGVHPNGPFASGGEVGVGERIWIEDKIIDHDLTLVKGGLLRVRFIAPGNPDQVRGNLYIQGAPGSFVPFSTTVPVFDGIPVGSFRVRYHTLRYSSGLFQLEMPESGVVDTVIELDTKSTVAGKVVDESGRLRGGVIYSVKNYSTDCTGEDGMLYVPDMSASRGTVELSHPDCPEMSVPIKPAGSGVMLITMEKSGKCIRGRIANQIDDSLGVCNITTTPDTSDPRTPWPPRNKHYESNADGTFSLMGLKPKLRYVVWIRCRGCSDFAATVENGTDLGDIVLHKAAPITGSVVDATSGEPLERFSIQVDPRAPQEFSDPRGDFTLLSYIHGAKNSLHVRSPGYVASHLELDLSSGLQTPLTVALQRAAVLKVRAIEGTKGVRDVDIWLYAPGVKSENSVLPRAFSGRTDSTGSLTFGQLPPDEYELHAFRFPYLHEIRTLSVNDKHSVTIPLRTGLTVEGIVTERSGEPVNGLQAALMRDPRFPGPTAPVGKHDILLKDGTFRFESVDQGIYTLVLCLPYKPEHRYIPVHRVENVSAGTMGMSVVLPPQRDLIIRPLYQGAPVKGGLTIWAGMPAAADSAGNLGMLRYTTSSPSEFSGTYQIPARVGNLYNIEIASGAFESRKKCIRVPQGKGPFEVAIELFDAPFMRGKISHHDSSTVLGSFRIEARAYTIPAMVLDHFSTALLRTANPDSTGGFVITRVTSGQFPIQLLDRGSIVFIGYGTATKGKDTRVLRVLPTGTLIGELRGGRRGDAVAYLSRREAQHIEIARAKVAADGSFRFAAVPVGQYLVSVGGYGRFAAATVQPGVSAGVTIDCKAETATPHMELKTQVRDLYPHVAALSSGGGWLYGEPGDIAAGSGNRVNFGVVDTGTHRIWACSYGRQPARCVFWDRTVRVGKGFPRINLSPCSTSCVVRCTGPDGSPVAGTEVSIRCIERDGSAKTARDAFGPTGSFFSPVPLSDLDGSLILDGLPTGQYVLLARHPSLASPPCTTRIERGGRSEVTLKMSPARTVRISALADGVPLQDYTVAVFDSSGALLHRTQRISPNQFADEVEWSFLDGFYTVRVFAPTMAATYRQLRVPSKATALEFVLEPAGWLELRGRQVQADSLEILDMRGARVPAELLRSGPDITDSRGNLTSLLVSSLAPGKYKVRHGTTGAAQECRIHAGEVSVVNVGQ